MPAWFGVSASILVGLFAAECSGRKSAGAFAALIMAIVPAHIMRSVAGGLYYYYYYYSYHYHYHYY